MPQYENRGLQSPVYKRKALAFRQGRTERGMAVLMTTEILRIAVGLRQIIRAHIAIAGDDSEMPEVRAEAAKVAYGGIDRLLDIGSHPKRPVGIRDGKHHVDLRTLLDLTPAAPQPVGPDGKESMPGLQPGEAT